MGIPVCIIDETGIHAPSLADIQTWLKEQFQAIYGEDIYLENDSQDGQIVGIYASAVNDLNALAVACYNSFSPATAQGAGLANVVKINGLTKAVASYSTVDLYIVGRVGVTILDGVASDGANNWLLPASVTIPPSGDITVTATAQNLGAITAAANTITSLATPTFGWQSVNNPSDAAPGAPVETDPALRKRQATSTAIPSLTVLEGTIGAVAAIPGVTRYRAYENDTRATDGNGQPGNSIALVVEGGDAMAIATAIAAKKSPGAQAYGTTTEVVVDKYGIPHTIGFFRPTMVPITCAITLHAMVGYTSSIETDLKQAVVDYINGVEIGGGVAGVVERDDAVAAARSIAGKATFRMASLTLSRTSGAGTPDVPLAFNEASSAADLSSITITVL